MPPYGGPCHGGASRAAFFFESRRTDGEAENRDCPYFPPRKRSLPHPNGDSPCFPPIGPAGRAPVPRGATASRRSGSAPGRSEEHTSELQSLMRISYAVFCLQKKIK